MGKPLNAPPDQGKPVIESDDNPVVRFRDLEKFDNDLDGRIAKRFARVYYALAVIGIVLFVPPDQRIEVVKQIPSAAVNGSPFFEILQRLF